MSGLVDRQEQQLGPVGRLDRLERLVGPNVG